MRWNSIRTREMLVLILACVLVVLVLGGIWIYMAKQYIEHDIYSSDIQDSRHMAESVSMYLKDITSNVDIISNSPNTVASLLENDTGHLKQISDNLIMSSPKPDGVVIANDSGYILYGSKPANLTNINMFNWYDDIQKSNGPYITGLYRSPPLNDYAFAILTPVKENSSIIGRIMIVFTQENFQDSLKEHNLDPRDNIIVVDGHGDVVSSNDLSAVNRNTNLSSYMPVQKVIRGESGVIVHSDSWDGQPRISAYEPIPNGGWGVIVSTPTRIEYQPLYSQMEWIIGILVFFTAVFSVIGYYLSKYLTDPIVNLSRTMDTISTGGHDVRVKMERKDEIGELAKTFNTMMDKLVEAKSQSDMYVDLMGHDINNMNQVAIGYLELANNLVVSGKTIEKGNEDLIKKPMKVLEDSSSLVENVRKLQKIRTEERQTKAIDLSETIKELKDRFSRVPGRNVSISFDHGMKYPVCADELIKDVFSNLLWNAIKHSNPNKPLAIGIRVGKVADNGKDYYRVAIEDDGPGIKDEVKKRLFSRFSRGETKAKGSGLGLYIVKSLVDRYDGRVWVEDRVGGDYTKGAKFIVMLPAAE